MQVPALLQCYLNPGDHFSKKDMWYEMECPWGSDCGTEDYNGQFSLSLLMFNLYAAF